MISILSAMPSAVGDMIQDKADLTMFLLVGALFIAIIAAMITLNTWRRRINLEQQRRVQGNKVYGGGQTQLPLMLNQANVIPVIFASPVITVVVFLAGFAGLDGLISNDGGGALYRYIFAGLIIFFTYFTFRLLLIQRHGQPL